MPDHDAARVGAQFALAQSQALAKAQRAARRGLTPCELAQVAVAQRQDELLRQWRNGITVDDAVIRLWRDEPAIAPSRRAVAATIISVGNGKWQVNRHCRADANGVCNNRVVDGPAAALRAAVMHCAATHGGQPPN